MSVDRPLPKGWCWATVGEICDADNGRAFKSTEWKKSGTPIIRIENLKKPDAKFNYFQGDLEAKHRVEEGDVLFAWSGTPGTSFGAHIWGGESAALNQHIFNIRFGRDLLDTQYLRHALNENVRSYVQQAQGGVGLAHITKSKFMASRIPLAPRSEQDRIVAALDTEFSKLDAAVAGLERVQANLKRYRASVLRAAVEGRLVPAEAELARQEGRDYEPAKVLLDRILSERRHRWEETELERLKTRGKVPSNDLWKGKYKEPSQPDLTGMPDLPEGWCWASLEQITSALRVICYGILMPKEHIPNGVLYVKVRDMKGDRLDVNSLPRTSPEIAAKYARASLRTGDLLLAIRGTYGRVVEVPPELDGGNITQDTARLDLHQELTRGYLRAYLLSPDAQNYFKRVARGVAVKGVNIAEVRTTPVSLPPLAEQERIPKEVDRHLSLVGELEREVEESRRRSDRLRQSILASAFAGKLAEQDARDEPASELLERIVQERHRNAQTTKARGKRRSK